MTTTAGYRARVEKANGCGVENNTMTLPGPRSTLPPVPDYDRKRRRTLRRSQKTR